MEDITVGSGKDDESDLGSDIVVRGTYSQDDATFTAIPESLPTYHLPENKVDSRVQSQGTYRGLVRDLVETPSEPKPSNNTTESERVRLWTTWHAICRIETYRVLLLLVLVANGVTLASLLGNHILDLPRALKAVSTNIFVAVAIRQEEVVNHLYYLHARFPLSTPLFLRRRIANLHHYGGIHAGCAVAATAWYTAYVVLTFRLFLGDRRAHAQPRDRVNLVTCLVFILILVAICLAALPYVRRRFHNTFELAHRFGGWSAILTLWIHTLAATADVSLFHSPSFYLLFFTTVLIIIPWLRMYRVEFDATTLSPRAVKLTFPYANMPFNHTIKVSTSPLLEWHAFATIPAPDQKSASIAVATAGDWTKRIVEAPPRHLYIRNPPGANFLLFVPLFRSALVVATGAGIGPVLSFLEGWRLATQRGTARSTAVKVLWCASQPFAREWDFARDTIYAVDPDAVIIDTSGQRVEGEQRERINVPLLVTEAVRKSGGGTEAVFVVSNKANTEKVIKSVRGLGVAAYGATFDS